jgi:hypothetical protein
MGGIMYKKFIVLILSIFVGLVMAEECKAQYDTLEFGDFGVSSVKPIGYESVRGKVWVDIENPLVGFTVSDIEGCLYKRGIPLVKGRPDDYYVPSGKSRLNLTGIATLCPGASLWDVLGLIFFQASQYTVDIKALVTDDGAQPVEMEVKNVPVLTLLKKDKKDKKKK